MSRRGLGEQGITYLILMVSLVVIGIAAMAAGQQWRMVILRDREAELLFRGSQIKRAIEAYHRSAHAGSRAYPSRLDDLLEVRDPRTGERRYFLRRRYTDPMTPAGEWVPVYDPSGGIRGVHSASDIRPLKQGRFPPEFAGFEGKGSYRDWVFEFVSPQ